MNFIILSIIAVLAGVAIAAPLRAVGSANTITPRSNGIQAQTLTPEFLQKRTPVGWDSKHVVHPSDAEFLKHIDRHRVNWELEKIPEYWAQQREKEEAQELHKQTWSVHQTQMLHDKAAANARIPQHASGSRRGGKGGSNPRGGR
ncbi:hypothetical protein MCOR25_010948 [Pyricularia grisea]|nr:hypothetical protein MCOR25_010948 [Pyricularia grisea]